MSISIARTPSLTKIFFVEFFESIVVFSIDAKKCFLNNHFELAAGADFLEIALVPRRAVS